MNHQASVPAKKSQLHVLQVTDTREVTGQEFVRGFLQNVLPTGFQRIRYYGFLSHNSKLTLGWLKMLVWF